MKTEFKTFEIRDRGTFIPAFAFAIDARKMLDVSDLYLVRRAGYALDERYVVLGNLHSCEAHYDPFQQPNDTMREAHLYVRDHWDGLRSGEVIDVEFITGQTATKKISERLSNYL